MTIEVFWRGYSHWTMFLLAGLLCVSVGMLNDRLPWSLGFIPQVLIGAAMVTALEFVVGCIVNLWLGWGVWDYSHLPGDILGQICPQYSLLWMPLVAVLILRDDLILWLGFNGDKPHYTLF